MDNKKEIYFGLVERPCRFGLRKWESLNLPWERMRCHGIIKAEPHSNWLILFKNIVQSVLDQNGRVLIVNRYNQKLFDVEYNQKTIVSDSGHKYQTHDAITTEIELDKISFNYVSPYVVKDFSELNDLKSFLWGRSDFKDASKRIIYIPESLSFEKNQHNEPIITSMVRDILNDTLGSPPPNEETDSSEKTLAESVPVLILTIGEPWYSDEPVLPAKLRALSISSFHLSFSMHDLSQTITANSRNQLFLFNKTVNAAKVDGADGFAHYAVEYGPPNFYGEVINALFKVK
jgi:hypothetical protein